MTICYMYVSIGIMYMIPAVKKLLTDIEMNLITYVNPGVFVLTPTET